MFHCGLQQVVAVLELVVKRLYRKRIHLEGQRNGTRGKGYSDVDEMVEDILGEI